MRNYVDVETSSVLDLGLVGTTRYASDRSTGLNCIGWAVGDGPVDILKWEEFNTLRGCARASTVTQKFMEMLRDPSQILVFHKADFERNIFKYVLGVEIDPRRVIDTMAKAGYYGYPRSLAGAAQALQCADLKDLGGKEVMKRLASGKFTPADAPDDFNRLYSYNAGDVKAMRGIDKSLPDLPPDIFERWVMDAEINDRGVPIDLEAINNALTLKAEIERENNDEMTILTDGWVTAVTQGQKMVEWLRETQSVFLPDYQADTITKALQWKNLPDCARQVLQLRQEAGLSSLSKFQSMADYQVNSRLHNMHDWYGAHTGRPTGTGPQVLNLPRSENPEFWAHALHHAPAIFRCSPKASERMKEALRGTLCAHPGNTFVGMDASQAEARKTGWFAGDQKFLGLFLTSDPYCTYGKSLFGHEINKKDHPDKRNAAKAAVLAFGFAGGIGAGQRIGLNYSFDFNVMADIILPSATPPELAEAHRNYDYYMKKAPAKPLSEREAMAVDILKQRYRRDFCLIANYWDQLEQAFLLGGQAGPIHIEAKASGLRILTLPHGRQLFYHGVKQYSDGNYSYEGRHGRTFIWKGVLIENCAQASSEDVMSWYRARANKEIAPVVHQCYDEFTMECLESRGDEVTRQLKELTATRPDFIPGLPLGFDYWMGRRYGK